MFKHFANGPGVDYPRKPNGSTPAVPGQPPSIRLGMTRRSWSSMRGTTRTAAINHSRLEQNSRIHGDCTICMAMSGSGARIGLATSITASLPRSIRQGRSPAMAAFCVAVPGTIQQTTAVPRFATSPIIPRTVTASLVFVWRELYSLSACAFTACCFTAFLLYLRGEERAAPKFFLY